MRPKVFSSQFAQGVSSWQEEVKEDTDNFQTKVRLSSDNALIVFPVDGTET